MPYSEFETARFPTEAPLTALVIGQRDDPHSLAAVDRLVELGYEVQACWTGQDRKEGLPDWILDWSGDVIFHIRSYHILPETLLARARIAAVNFHPSPPHYRGAGCYNWALYNGDAEYGVTAHIMDREIDHGPILKVYPMEIRPEDTLATLIARCHELQVAALSDIAAAIADNPTAAVRELTAAYAGPGWSETLHRISEIDALQSIPPTASKEEVDRIIRATRIGRFKPYIELNGYRFTLADADE